MEVMACGVTKGAALGTLLEQQGLSPADVICFGVGLNDLEMLRLVADGPSTASDRANQFAPSRGG